MLIKLFFLHKSVCQLLSQTAGLGEDIGRYEESGLLI